MIITRTPFRISLGGGGTDLPSYYSKYGGFIFSATLNKYMYVCINRPSADGLIRIKYSKSETVESIEEIKHELVRESLRHTGIKNNIEIASLADVPAGTGLGSSGAYLVGLLKGLHELKRENLQTQELAEEACKIEIEVLKKPVGKHDQYLAAFGGFTIMDIEKDGKVMVSKAKISRDTVEGLENKLVMYFTGISRESSSILEKQSAQAEIDESEVTKSLTRIKEIGMEIKSSLENGDLRNFGKLMDEHWKTKKRMSNKISNPQIDDLYDLAKENGVLGGKIMGAGGGGFFLFYCDGDKKKLREVMVKNGLKEMPFKFELEGSKVLVNI